VRSAPPLASITVGVVVERRKARSAWIDFTWAPVAVLPGAPTAAPWTLLAEEGDTTRFYAGATDIALYRTETSNYRNNLASGRPSLWVALRPTGSEPPYDVLAVTADPAEGEAFTQAGDDLVEAVPMPAPIVETLAAFIAGHFTEQPFVRRERDRADPEALARPTPAAKERDE
jgi:hypothetical protein